MPCQYCSSAKCQWNACLQVVTCSVMLLTLVKITLVLIFILIAFIYVALIDIPYYMCVLTYIE